MFYERNVRKIDAKFTGKHLCRWKTPVPGSLFSKVKDLLPAASLKKRLCLMCFPFNFNKFLQTPLYKPTPSCCFLILIFDLF